MVEVGAAPSAAVAGLVAASIAENTKRTYAAALKRLDAALEGQDLTDASLSIYLASLHAVGPSPVGPATDRVLAGLRREGKGRGQLDGVRFSEGDPGRRLSVNAIRRIIRSRRGLDGQVPSCV